MNKEPVQRKSSKSKQPTPPNNELVPQFACAVWIDNNGNQQMTYNLAGNFPKRLILPGLLLAASHVKANLLDKVQPSEDNDRAFELLKDIVEKQAESDEVGVDGVNILRLHPKPIKSE